MQKLLFASKEEKECTGGGKDYWCDEAYGCVCEYYLFVLKPNGNFYTLATSCNRV